MWLHLLPCRQHYTVTPDQLSLKYAVDKVDIHIKYKPTRFVFNNLPVHVSLLHDFSSSHLPILVMTVVPLKLMYVVTYNLLKCIPQQ